MTQGNIMMPRRPSESPAEQEALNQTNEHLKVKMYGLIITLFDSLYHPADFMIIFFFFF